MEVNWATENNTLALRNLQMTSELLKAFKYSQMLCGAREWGQQGLVL